MKIVHPFFCIFLINILFFATARLTWAGSFYFDQADYEIRFFHDRDEFELSQELNATISLSKKTDLFSQQNHMERFNKTLKRRETRWGLDFQQLLRLDDRWRIQLEMNYDRITDNRTSDQLSGGYKSTTTHRKISSSLQFSPSSRVVLESEIGYSHNTFDRTVEIIQPKDQGSFMHGRLAFYPAWANFLDGELTVSSHNQFRDIRQSSEHNLAGQLNLNYSAGALRPIAWAFKQSFLDYEYPSGQGIEKKKLVVSAHELSLAQPLTSWLNLRFNGQADLTRADYDSIQYVINVDRKDHRQYQFEGSLAISGELTDAIAVTSLFSQNWRQRDYNSSNIDDLKTIQRKWQGTLAYSPSQADTIRVNRTMELIQHTYLDSTSTADRDILNENLGLDWVHYFTAKLVSQLDLGVTQTHLINLSRFLSADNHRVTHYYLYPEVTYRTSRGFLIREGVKLNANYYLYDFPSDDGINPNDRLIRQFSIYSHLEIPLSVHFTFKTTYRYEPQDNGSYIRNLTADERRYNRNRKQMTDALILKMAYSPSDFIRLEPEFVYQETRLWNIRDDTPDELINRRRQTNYGLSSRYESERVKFEALAWRTYRWQLPDYWHTECSMTVTF